MERERKRERERERERVREISWYNVLCLVLTLLMELNLALKSYRL